MNTNENASAPQMDQINISTTVVAGANRRILARSRNHEIVMDVRKEWGGDNAGPTPPECMAMALGGCILNICRIIAMQKHMVLDDLRISISGEIDPSRAFGIHTEIRAGFSHLTVRVEMSSKLSDAEKEEFRRELIERCPLCDTISNPTSIQITLAQEKVSNRTKVFSEFQRIAPIDCSGSWSKKQDSRIKYAGTEKPWHIVICGQLCER